MITYKHLKDIVNLCKKRNKLKHLIKINKTDLILITKII